MKFYDINYQRKIPQSVFPNKKIDLKPSLPIKSQYAFEDVFKRKAAEHRELLSRADHIDDKLDRPKLLKVDLGDSTLKKLLEIDVPDSSDTSWINEKNRIINNLRAQGMSESDINDYLKQNPPLGRQQNTIKQNSTLSASSLSMSKKIDELKEEVTQGRVKNNQDMANIIIQLSEVLNDQKQLVRIGIESYKSLQILLKKLPDTINSSDFDIPYRFIDRKYFNSKSGVISTLILKQAQLKNYPIDTPIIGVMKNGVEKLISLKTFFDAMARNNHIIDLDYKNSKMIAVIHKDIIFKQIGNRIVNGENSDDIEKEFSDPSIIQPSIVSQRLSSIKLLT